MGSPSSGEAVAIILDLQLNNNILTLKATKYLSIQELVEALQYDRKVLTLEAISQFQDIGKQAWFSLSVNDTELAYLFRRNGDTVNPVDTHGKY